MKKISLLTSHFSLITYHFSLLFAVCCRSVAAPATESDSALTDLQRAIAMVDATMQHTFTDGNSLRMYDLYNTVTHQGSGTADVWPYTAALEAHCSVLEALDALQTAAPQLYQDTHDRYVARLKQLFGALDYYRGTYTLYSYAQIKSWSIYGVHRSNTKGTAAVAGIENVYDDQMWLCRELVRAYRLTGDADYLQKAEYLANYCIDGWDCCLDADGQEYGGITWGPGYNSKHSCSNGPLIQPLVWLYEIYNTADEEPSLRYFYILPDGTRTNAMRRHSEVYLEFARKIYAWQKQKLYNASAGVYHDMLGAPGELKYVGEGRNRYRDHVDTGSPTGTAYTYNTGTMLAATAELYRVTGEADYLSDLNTLCSKTWTYFAKGTRKDGVVYREWPTDKKAEEGFNAWFDNVLMRAYVDAAPYNTTLYNSQPHTTNALLSYEQNLDYAYGNHNRDQMLPIDLLGGWSVSTGDADVTKGFHQLAFAAEYAMLAVWRQRRAVAEASVAAPPASGAAAKRTVYSLDGRTVSTSAGTSQLPRGIYVSQGRKVLLHSHFTSVKLMVR